MALKHKLKTPKLRADKETEHRTVPPLNALNISISSLWICAAGLLKLHLMVLMLMREKEVLDCSHIWDDKNKCTNVNTTSDERLTLVKSGFWLIYLQKTSADFEFSSLNLWPLCFFVSPSVQMGVFASFPVFTEVQCLCPPGCTAEDSDAGDERRELPLPGEQNEAHDPLSGAGEGSLPEDHWTHALMPSPWRPDRCGDDPDQNRTQRESQNCSQEALMATRGLAALGRRTGRHWSVQMEMSFSERLLRPTAIVVVLHKSSSKLYMCDVWSWGMQDCMGNIYVVFVSV